MFDIYLYNFNKKPNSLDKPGISDVPDTYKCVMKTISSVITPVIEIADTKGTNRIPLYNYAYIPDFQRYYFVEDVRYDIGVWTISMRCDVLATYRTDILNSRQYVLRSSSDYNDDLVDTFYNTYIDPSTCYSRVLATSDPEEHLPNDTWRTLSYYFSGQIGQGCFVIGVVGTVLTGVNYYLMPTRVFRRFLNNGFQMVPSDMTSVDTGIGQALYNYLQYVTYCKWFPFMPAPSRLAQYTAVTEIPCGSQSVDVSASGSVDDCYQISSDMVIELREQITIPRHPQASSYSYMDLSPFSQYTLYFQPFGCIPIDSTKIYGSTYLTLKWYIDFCTGCVELRAYADNGALVYTESTQIGVTIPISSMIVDWKVGAGVSALTWLKTAAEEISGGADLSSFGNAHRNMNDVRASIESAAPDTNKSLIDTIMDTTMASLGQCTTKGQPASFLSYQMGKPFIFAYFMNQTAHDPDLFGMPLCEDKRLDNLSGFVLCGNAVVDYVTGNPTVDEQNAIISMLNSGVFL